MKEGESYVDADDSEERTLTVMHQRPFEVGAMKGESTMIRLNTMLTKRGFHKPFADKDYWVDSRGNSVFRNAHHIIFNHAKGPIDPEPTTCMYDRKDKEGVMRHIHTLEVKL